VSDLVPRDSLKPESLDRAELERRDDEREERRRLARQAALAIVLALALAARIVFGGSQI
jgi:hypothetical protein